MSDSVQQQLQKYLDEHDHAMDFVQLQGYLFALVCAPQPIEPELWLVDVLGEQAAKSDESVLFALMNAQQQVSDQVYSEGFNLRKVVQLRQPWLHNFANDAPILLWSQGFAIGVSYYIEPLLTAQAVDDNSREMLLQAVTVLSLFSEQQAFCAQAAQSGQSEQQFAEVLFDMMADFSLGFAELIELVAVQSGLFDDEQEWDG
ncbi:UPF0149 family protein [Pseudoalteromonas ruthenica]|uniref:UPF0149 family protein n=1 Tax=Pseudoalteromonas ruthenica TaxID=151081 RepID=UPI00110B21C3|nr:UPF0149 family protein [Pseudoalteromonas ruthenica]TMO44193.1 YecA family protein [Pseudoalteromonas ruthenica]TMO52965.1 YecA family protein [Pseudoalteromonas ruthenica]